MAKIKPIETVKSMSGKVCEHSEIYFRTNKQTGKTVTGKLCNPSDTAPTEAQLKTQTRFTKLSEAARLIIADPEQRSKYEKAYKKQHRIGSLLGYIITRIKHLYDENGDLIA
ncbi:MAG: hypothetical protein IIW65_01925 [Alistipes sp.]|nr:hypothetical protein [Alistipes sp.]